MKSSSKQCSPLDWAGYFDQEEDVCISDTNDVFHLYMTGTEGPVVFCLHGGGYSGYEGLSEKFLSCPVPKLLLLAGTDMLDRALTIGQMRGKFQMVVVGHTGHAIQEDVPDEFATLILNFVSRNHIGPHGVEIRGLCRPAQP